LACIHLPLQQSLPKTPQPECTHSCSADPELRCFLASFSGLFFCSVGLRGFASLAAPPLTFCRFLDTLLIDVVPFSKRDPRQLQRAGSHSPSLCSSVIRATLSFGPSFFIQISRVTGQGTKSNFPPPCGGSIPIQKVSRPPSPLNATICSVSTSSFR